MDIDTEYVYKSTNWPVQTIMNTINFINQHLGIYSKIFSKVYVYDLAMLHTFNIRSGRMIANCALMLISNWHDLLAQPSPWYDCFHHVGNASYESDTARKIDIPDA